MRHVHKWGRGTQVNDLTPAIEALAAVLDPYDLLPRNGVRDPRLKSPRQLAERAVEALGIEQCGWTHCHGHLAPIDDEKAAACLTAYPVYRLKALEEK